MSSSITIRDVPDEALAALTTRAAAEGRSLEDYVRDHLIVFAQHPDAEKLLASVRGRKAATGTVVSVEEVLNALDADRR